ncbi:MAG: patatin-like phospholipase family protein [Proteobacteria bacterium]|nr:patatin-like phospholipase family protein [Pseudomonadota bacterium]
MPDRRLIRVLSIDGGGVRGLIPATILSHLEQELGARCSDLFDLIAGTSTGGIIALGLTKPARPGSPALSAADLVDFYRSDSKRIFGEKTGVALDLLRPRYNMGPIRRVLREKFRKVELKDAVTDVVITAYNLSTRSPFTFRSWHAQTQRDRNFRMCDVARATSAAPTFFPPANISPVGLARTHRAQFVDGGVYANNPGARALVEAIARFTGPGELFSKVQIMLVSLGTGSLLRDYPYKETRKWGLAKWARPLLDIVFDGVSDHVDQQLTVLLDHTQGLGSLYRFQADLTEASDDMDNTDPVNLQRLHDTALRILDRNQREFREVCERLARHRSVSIAQNVVAH